MKTCPRICPNCGAHLDASEHCDCENETVEQPAPPDNNAPDRIDKAWKEWEAS